MPSSAYFTPAVPPIYVDQQIELTAVLSGDIEKALQWYDRAKAKDKIMVDFQCLTS
jgi:hypothetical protein